MNYFHFLVLVNLMTAIQMIIVRDRFLYCIDKDEYVDISQNCNKTDGNLQLRFEYFECEIRNQIFKMRSNVEDSFFKFDGSVFHVQNGSIKYTLCNDISEIEIHENVEKCTKDILVSFPFNSSLVFGFLTNENIIRPKNKLIPCPIDTKVFPVKHLNLVKKGNKIKPIEIFKIFKDLKNMSDNPILSYYERNLEHNREFRMGYDIILSIISLVNLVYFCKTKKNFLNDVFKKSIK